MIVKRQSLPLPGTRLARERESRHSMAAASKWFAEIADLAALRTTTGRGWPVQPYACECGNEKCDGKSYRPPYSSVRVSCPRLASVQSSENTAVSTV
jgi:hypothetical protein